MERRSRLSFLSSSSSSSLETSLQFFSKHHRPTQYRAIVLRGWVSSGGLRGWVSSGGLIGRVSSGGVDWVG